LREIKDTKWEFARRLLQGVSVAFRPLRAEELAEIFAFDFEAGQIPKFREDWRPENTVETVLSTCSTMISLVTYGESQAIQFAHFSVKEFLTSAPLAQKHGTISHRYHISTTPAHTLVAQACLGMLLNLGRDQNITRHSLVRFPLVEYAGEYWFDHAHFEGVAKKVDEGMRRLFDKNTSFDLALDT
jgi:hypothetical protein